MKAGITGHQDLGNETIVAWLRQQILAELDGLQIDMAFSCLAIGADQLFAHCIVERNIPITAVIPCHNYNKTFDDEGLKTYYSLLHQAVGSIQLNYEEPGETAFYEAGKLVANNSDILFAVWNNKPARGLGGTADIVAYAVSLGKKIIHFDPGSKVVRHIN